MGILVVVNGATMSCTQGTQDSELAATHEPSVALNGQTVASVLDHKGGTNIPPFGNCKAKEKKKGKPCSCDQPQTPEPWKPGGHTVLLPTLSDVAVVVSLLECTEGGIIQITDPGQSTMEIEGEAESSILETLLDVLAQLPDELPEALLESLAMGLGFGSAAELLKYAADVAESMGNSPRWALKLLRGKAKVITLVEILVALRGAGKGDIKEAIAQVLGVGVGAGVTAACTTAAGTVEAGTGAGAILIPATAAGCGVIGGVVGEAVTEISKPAIDIVGDIF